MKTILRNMKLYLWPILALNATTMTVVIGGNTKRGLFFSFVISLLASFGFLLNDLWDRDVDRVNQSGRFECSTRRTITAAIAVCAACLISGLSLAFWMGLTEARIACFLFVGLAAYSIVLRRLLIAPTVLAALLAASPLWAPLVLWPRDVRPLHWIFVAAIVLLLAGRETLMDVRDRKGDSAGARATVATVFGARIAKFAAAAQLLGGAMFLCFVLISRVSTLPADGSLAASVVLSLILVLVLIPAHRATRSSRESDTKRVDDYAIIQIFVLRSRAAMAFLPLLILFLWKA